MPDWSTHYGVHRGCGEVSIYKFSVSRMLPNDMVGRGGADSNRWFSIPLLNRETAKPLTAIRIDSRWIRNEQTVKFILKYDFDVISLEPGDFIFDNLNRWKKERSIPLGRGAKPSG